VEGVYINRSCVGVPFWYWGRNEYGLFLFIVGSTALVGGVRNASLGNVNYKTAVVFTIPAFIAVYATRAYLVPAIPNEIMTVGTYVLTKDIAIMVFFALVMLAASVSMIRNKRKEEEEMKMQCHSSMYPPSY